MKQYKKNKGLKNCPNDGVFYFACNYLSPNPNHMIKSVTER